MSKDGELESQETQGTLVTETFQATYPEIGSVSEGARKLYEGTQATEDPPETQKFPGTQETPGTLETMSVQETERFQAIYPQTGSVSEGTMTLDQATSSGL
eukprot:gene24467-10071_t